MASFKKAILREDTYISPDRPDEPLVVTAERLRHWEAKHKEIIKKGRRIPIDFDHGYTPEDNVPITNAAHEKRRSAKNSVGFMEVFRVGQDEKGHFAEILLDITDPDAKGRCDRNEVYVSPVILDNWTDGKGKLYEDIIGHCDLVNHPVDASQTPFEKVGPEPGAIACGIRLGLGEPQHPSVFRLAIGEAEMADHADDDKKDKDKKDNTDHNDDNDRVGGDGEASGGVDPSKIAKQVMDKIGAEVPTDFDPMTPEGFTLMMTAVINKLSSEDDPLEEEGELEAQAPEFATLSTNHPARQAFEFSQKAHRSTVGQRLEAAFKSGRVTKAEFDSKTPLVNKVRLSLDSAGEQKPGKLEAWLEAREELPPGSVWPGEQNQATHLSTGETRPKEWNPNAHKEAKQTPERAKEVADWVMGNE